VVMPIAGQKHWSWQAVDQDGYVLDRTPLATREPANPKND
jgi:transposase-like protein